MTRAEILSQFFTSKDFNDCIKKMEPVQLQDDLKAEVALILCEMPEDKVSGLWERKELKFYTVRIILNLIKSNTSPFYKKFRISGIDLDELTSDLAVRFSKDNTTSDIATGSKYKIDKYIIHEDYNPIKDIAIAEIDNLYWYDREILKLYAEHGTYRKVEEVTGIPFESIYKTVIKNCKLIRMKVA